MAARPDPFVQAHLDALNAVRTFLPSLGPKSAPPPAPARPPSEPERALSLVAKTEKMAARVARGMPPEEPPPPTPEKNFGNQLDIVHTRALAAAIAAHPETERGRLISEAHDSAVKWIASHNGKVVVHGKVELAHGPEQAEKLAQRIVNATVEEHDQRRAEAVEAERAASDPANQGKDEPAPDDRRGSVVHRGAGSATARPANPAANSGERAEPPVSTVGPGNGGSAPGRVPATAPEIVSPGDGGETPTGPPPAVSAREAAKVGTQKPDGHQITQPKASVEANQKLALDAAPELHAKLGELTSQVPGARYDRLRPQKSADRLDQKVADKNGADTLSDYLGAQIAADSPEAKDALLKLLKDNFPTIEVDDRFLDGRDDKAGYPSANAQVQMGNGMTAEVQIVPREVQDRTEESHQFYKAGREAEEAGDTAERDQQWAKAKEIHQQALTQFKERNGIKSNRAESSPVGGYQVLGEPIRIGSHTFLRVAPGQGDQAEPPASPAAPAESQASPAATSADTAGDAGTQSASASRSTDLSPATASVEALPGAPASTAAPSPDSIPQLAKGQTVQLKDGSTGKVIYAHPYLPHARVQIDGEKVNSKGREINTKRDLA
jgi:hypothetical protein